MATSDAASPTIKATRVAWIAVAVLQRVWPVWIALTLLSLTFVVPRLARSQVVSWRGRWVWVFVVALLGPFGLLVYLFAHPTGGH